MVYYDTDYYKYIQGVWYICIWLYKVMPLINISIKVAYMLYNHNYVNFVRTFLSCRYFSLGQTFFRVLTYDSSGIDYFRLVILYQTPDAIKKSLVRLEGLPGGYRTARSFSLITDTLFFIANLVLTPI